jgi:carbon storage regulator
MLILTRRQHETLELPDLGIQIVVARIDGDAVRLGINAPRDVRIFRGEVWTAIDERRSDWVEAVDP